MVVFSFVVGNMVILMTGVTGGVIVVFSVVADDMVMLMIGVNGGVMVVFSFWSTMW
jgi:hypothetical protein